MSWRAEHYPGLFARFAPLSGEHWLKDLPQEDRQAFSYLGRSFAQHGSLGGVARAQTAKRDSRGRFVKER